MRRFTILITVIMALFGLLLMSVPTMAAATDNTRRPGWYDRFGWTAYDMFSQVMDSSNFVQDMYLAIDDSLADGSSFIKNQLKRRIYTIPLFDTFVRAAWPTDSIRVLAFSVPTGVTFYADSFFVSCLTEGDADSVQGGFRIMAWAYDPDSTRVDTLITDQTLDGDSIATINYLLTKNTTDWVEGATLKAGTYIVVKVSVTGPWATAPSAYGLSIKGRLDE